VWRLEAREERLTGKRLSRSPGGKKVFIERGVSVKDKIWKASSTKANVEEDFRGKKYKKYATASSGPRRVRTGHEYA